MCNYMSYLLIGLILRMDYIELVRIRVTTNHPSRSPLYNIYLYMYTYFACTDRCVMCLHWVQAV